MLKIYVGRKDDELYFVDSYFNNMPDIKYKVTELSKEIIKNIDDSIVLGSNAIHSNFK